MKFLGRSLLILLALYGLVFAIGDLYLAHAQAPLWSAIVFVVVLIGTQYLIAPWLIQLVLAIDFTEELPARNREFVEHLCAERGLKVPRIGIIRSGTPNAFSFGHVPANSRVVVTTGLLEVLSPEETNAVLAHEIGHIEHWDFVVMAIAALAPLLLYQIYVFTQNVNKIARRRLYRISLLLGESVHPVVVESYSRILCGSLRCRGYPRAGCAVFGPGQDCLWHDPS